MPFPVWFRDRVAALKAVGFLGNVELSDDDLEFQWNRYDGDAEPGILGRMLARHLRRAFELPVQVLHPHVRMKPILDGLVEIAGGRFVLGDVSEQRDGLLLRALELTTPRGRWELAIVGHPVPDKTFPVLDNRALLAGLNAIADAGAFCFVNQRAVFVDEHEHAALVAAEVEVDVIAPDASLAKRTDATAVPKRLVKPVVLSEIAPADNAPEVSAARPAFRPQLRRGVPGPGLLDPRCDCCDGPTALLVQHALSDLPIGLRRTGTLQLFVCRGADPDACFIEHRGLAVRITPTAAPAQPLYAIAAWEPFDDQPGPTDWETAGLDEEAAEEEGLDAEDGWKSGGWPAWLQERATACPRCGKDCALALQVPSLDDIHFADGRGFVLVCDHAPCTWAGAVLQYS